MAEPALVEQIAEIAKQGLGWSLAIIEAGYILKLLGKAEKTAELRLADYKSLHDLVAGFNLVQTAINVTSEARTRALEDLARSHALGVASQADLVKKVNEVTQELVDLRKENQRLREALIQAGGLTL